MPAEAPRWRRRKEARPQEIVAAALDVFVERGFAAARLEEVARRAGVAKGTLYLYFPTKEELFKAVVRSAIVTNLEDAERLLAAHSGPSMDLLAGLLLGIGATVMGSRIGAIPKLVIAESGNFPDLARFYHDEVIRRGFAVIAAILRRGVDRGEFRPMNLDHAVRLVVAPLLLIGIWRTTFEPATGVATDAQGLIRAHLDHLARSFAAEGPT